MSEEVRPASWKPWNWPWSVWGLVTVLMLAMLPFVVRAYFLSAVPVMAEPFDIAAFVGDEIPVEENAFTEYRQVFEMRNVLMQGLHQKSASEPASRDYEEVYTGGWEASSDGMRAWLEAHRPALAIWRRGTEKSRALDVLPSERPFETVWGASQDLQDVVPLVLVDQMRWLHEGNVDEAWKLARAAYRSGGHVSQRGVVITGLFSTVIHDMSSEGMQRWAEHPAVTADQLRASLANVTADFALYESESNLLRTDYVALRSSLSRPEWAGMMGSNFSMPLIDKIVPASVVSGFMWVVGEPELTIRITRQIVANQTREVDKSLAERRQLSGSRMTMLFDTDPTVTLGSAELDAKQLDSGIKASILAKMVLPATKQLDDAYMRLRGRQAALEVMLATQAYRRDKGEFPESLDALIPQYLEAVPFDPCDRNGGRIHYRRDSTTNAVVWSAAQDGNDDGGAVETGKSRTADVGFILK